jgi:hypothetical protein
MKGKSFSFLPFEEEHTAFSTKLNDIEVWHKRLGHCYQQWILSIKKYDVVKGVPSFTNHLPNCNACPFGKQSRKPFPKSTWRFTRKLQLIHTNVTIHLNTPSLKGSRYCILFIDDFTRMCWIFFYEIQVRSNWDVLEIQEEG